MDNKAMRRFAKINFILAIVFAAIPMILNEWEAYVHHSIDMQLIGVRLFCYAARLIILVISLVMLILFIVMLLFRLVLRLFRKDIKYVIDIRSTITHLATVTIIIVLPPLVTPPPSVIPFIFLVSAIFFAHLISKFLRKNIKPVVIFLAYILLFIAPFLFHIHYTQLEMKTRALILSEFPRLCQQNKRTLNDTYVCYYYAWDDAKVFFFTNIHGEYWFVIDKTDTMRDPPETWPEDFAYTVFDFNPNPRFAQKALKGLKVEPMGRHVYLVSRIVEF